MQKLFEFIPSESLCPSPTANLQTSVIRRNTLVAQHRLHSFLFIHLFPLTSDEYFKNLSFSYLENSDGEDLQVEKYELGVN